MFLMIGDTITDYRVNNPLEGYDLDGNYVELEFSVSNLVLWWSLNKVIVIDTDGEFRSIEPNGRKLTGLILP